MHLHTSTPATSSILAFQCQMLLVLCTPRGRCTVHAQKGNRMHDPYTTASDASFVTHNERSPWAALT